MKIRTNFITGEGEKSVFSLRGRMFKLEILSNDGRYCLSVDEDENTCTYELMNFLDMEPHDFFPLFHKHNGIWDECMYFFENKSDVRNLINELEPILIMNKLIK